MDLGIISTDAFEQHLLQYLKSGLFEPETFRSVVNGYLLSSTYQKKQERLRRFFEALYWDSKKSRENLLEEITTFEPDIADMPFASVTALSNAAGDLGDPELADRLITARIASFNAWTESHSVAEAESMFPTEMGSINPRLIAAQEAARERQYPPLSLMEVVERMIKNSGWGEREVQSLKAATVLSYLQELQSLDAAQLAAFLRCHMTWIAPNNSYFRQEGFSHALPCFLEACRKIVNEGGFSPRLKKIIKDVFEHAGQGVELKAAAA